MPHLFDYYPSTVSEWQIRRDASQFDISPQSAIRMKLRYAIEAAEIWLDVGLEPVYWQWVDIIIKLRDIESRLRLPRPTRDITDAMIEQARERDIRSVVDFNRGKAIAWCHDDKNPSLTYMSRTNRAWCAACGKYFDPIGVLMNRDGMNFASAVRYLCS